MRPQKDLVAPDLLESPVRLETRRILASPKGVGSSSSRISNPATPPSPDEARVALYAEPKLFDTAAVRFLLQNRAEVRLDGVLTGEERARARSS